ncbi:MAG: Phosphoglycolate phosphatase [Chroococcopsis gigantea SAG 12.99]|jgi:phosphoglycolate phosphatase|nr:HAD family hydrolase [Chlorogloea purpurea SAG 13.99]MDV3000672.1 Phosphoglycolate phosphatase [Chroococcopsis gigantea SAG 12.99]
MVINISIGDRVFRDIEGIIFDKDGTLEDSGGYWAEIGVKRVQLIEERIPGISPHLFKVFGFSQIKPNPLLERFGLMAEGSCLENEIAAAAYIAETGRGWSESRAIVRQAFLDADQSVKKTSRLFPDCLRVLKTCVDSGLRLGIVSADTTPNIGEFINTHELSPYIKVAIGSDRGKIKPDQALFEEACQILGVRPGRVLMVGDSETDIEMGKKAGAAGVIGIVGSDSPGRNLEGADIIIRGLQEIIQNLHT